MGETNRLEGKVEAVSLSPVHSFSKTNAPEITLLEGLGVEGDAHHGTTVKHRSRVRANPLTPNYRQVHLIQCELFDELASHGFAIKPGEMGENIATRGLDLLALPTATRLALGPQALIEITGLRNPCYQIDDFRQGLLKHVVSKDEAGQIIRRAGIMAVVIAGGVVKPGDGIMVHLPQGPHRPLEMI